MLWHPHHAAILSTCCWRGRGRKWNLLAPDLDVPSPVPSEAKGKRPGPPPLPLQNLFWHRARTQLLAI